MEMIACAWKCWHDPSASTKWLDSKKDWAAYERTFAPGNLRGALNELVAGMNDVHKQLSRFAHPSIASVVMSISSHRVVARRLFDVDYTDDRIIHRAGYGRALTAERILDSQEIHAALLYGFCRRALRNHWDRAATVGKRPLVMLLRRVRGDQRFYRHLVATLDPYRERNQARIRAAKDGPRRPIRVAETSTPRL
jgi:hypothetical protein